MIAAASTIPVAGQTARQATGITSTSIPHLSSP